MLRLREGKRKKICVCACALSRIEWKNTRWKEMVRRHNEIYFSIELSCKYNAFVAIRRIITVFFCPDKFTANYIFLNPAPVVELIN